MITKLNAIKIAEDIAVGGLREIKSLSDVNKIHSVRGAIYAALDNIWYDTLNPRIRDQFTGAKTPHDNFLDIANKILDSK